MTRGVFQKSPYAALPFLALGVTAITAVLLRRNSSRKTKRRTRAGLPVVRVYFLRHAQTTNNVRSNKRADGIDVKTVRDSDPGLTDVGLQQSKAAAVHLRDNLHLMGLKTIYCSPMRKALSTFAPIADALADRVSCRIHFDAFEHGGVFRGDKSLSPEERAKLDPHYGLEWSKITDIVSQCAFDEAEEANRYSSEFGPGSLRGWHTGVKETPETYFARIERLADWIYSLRENTLLISHGKTLDTLLKCIIFNDINSELEKTSISFLHSACAVTCLELQPQGAALLYINDNILPLELRTGHNLSGFRLLDQEIKKSIRPLTQL